MGESVNSGIIQGDGTPNKQEGSYSDNKGREKHFVLGTVWFCLALQQPYGLRPPGPTDQVGQDVIDGVTVRIDLQGLLL